MFGDAIRQAAKPTVITTIVIVAIVLAITVALDLWSSAVHDKSEELYDFVTAAKIFHEKIEGKNLLEDIRTLIEIVAHESPENSSEIESSIRQGMLSARGYREQFNWLYPTTDSLELFESLIREGSLIESCYSKLYLAWSEKQSGDESHCAQYLEKVRVFYDEAVSLREQNKLKLDSLLLQFEQNHSR
ncbi:hypothetical protein ES703_123558 [subsurface metagenome]